MKTNRLILLLFAALLVPLGIQAQDMKSIALPRCPKGVSKDMADLYKVTFSRVNDTLVSVKDFDKYVKKARKLIKRNEEDRACGYLVLGNLYHELKCNQRHNDSLAVIYYDLSEPLFDQQPQNKPFRNALDFYRGNMFLRNGPLQDTYHAYLHYSTLFHSNPKMGLNLCRMYLYGWGVESDFFLATVLLDICALEGYMSAHCLLSYIRHIAMHPEELVTKARSYAAFENYSYLDNVIFDGKGESLSPLTQSAEWGNPMAQYFMGLYYSQRNCVLPPNTTRRNEIYRWNRASADQGFGPALSGLAVHCFLMTIDPDQGDIFTPDSNGKYSIEDRCSIQSKIEELFQEAEQKEYLPAMHNLAEQYMNDEDDPCITTDFEQAYFWGRVTEMKGSSMAGDFLRRLNKVMKAHNYELSDETRRKLDQRASSRAFDNQYRMLDIVQHLARDPEMRYPSGRHSDNLRMNIPDSVITQLRAQGVTPGTEQSFFRAELYKMVYDMYSDRAAAVAKNIEQGNSDNRIIYFQRMMKYIREQAHTIPYCFITASKWEAWTYNEKSNNNKQQ